MRYLKIFFNEKNLDSRTYEVTASDGTTHLVDSEIVIDTILNGTPREEQEKIANVLRKIDFANGDVHHFLEHLSGALVENFVQA